MADANAKTQYRFDETNLSIIFLGSRSFGPRFITRQKLRVDGGCAQKVLQLHEPHSFGKI